MSEVSTSTKIHPFEQAGLGQAPFRFVGVTERRGPILINRSASGVEEWAGAPGQPMGCCKFCFQGIAICCEVMSADGKLFDVGSDCIAKVYSAGTKVLTDVQRAIRKIAKDKETARWQAARERVKTDEALRDALRAKPHPLAFRAEKGDTRLSWAEWMLSNAGHSGRLDVAKYIERLLPAAEA